MAKYGMSSYDIVMDARNNKTQYRCVEYGKVLNDALISFGYISRAIALKSIDLEYGGVGKGHVATEVWSNNYNKWLFLDPQKGTWMEHNSKPISFLDAYNLRKANKFNEIIFKRIVKNGVEDYEEYRKFINNYFGFIGIQQIRNKKKISKTLILEGKGPYIVFQALPDNHLVFTNNPEELYFQINETVLILDFTQEEIQRTEDELAKIDFTKIEDYISNTYKFAAKPDFHISVINDVPWYKESILALDGKEINAVNGFFHIKLKDGENVIRAYSINQLGVKTKETFIKIKYE